MPRGPMNEDSTNTGEPVIDRDHLERATGGDTALMAELLEMLERELPVRKRHLDESLADGDLAAAAEAAHRLRGAGAYTGALTLERLAGRLEERLHAGDRAAISQALRDLEQHLATLQAALRDSASVTR